MAESILVVEDEAAIRQMLSFTLRGAGYDCEDVGDVDAAQSVLAKGVPSLILLDWMLPGVSGIDFARRLRHNPQTKHIPIIILTARGEEEDKVKGLEGGADDYVTKPFSTKELLARIRAVLRRANGADEGGVIEVEGLRLDRETHRVTVKGHNLDLSPTEFRLLDFFVSHPERVYTRSQLLDHVWGDNVYIEERTIDVHIRRLRKILTPVHFDRYIQTVRSVGYRFSVQM
jgi:two-component system phosphate regulon response regulator PhoB